LDAAHLDCLNPACAARFPSLRCESIVMIEQTSILLLSLAKLAKYAKISLLGFHLADHFAWLTQCDQLFMAKS
jgi:hypothetical protein